MHARDDDGDPCNDQYLLRVEKVASYLIKNYDCQSTCFDLVNAQYHMHTHDVGKEKPPICAKKNCLKYQAKYSPFEGESALHLAIAFNHAHLVHLLLAHGASLEMRARGEFFVTGSGSYYGTAVARSRSC